MRDSAEDTDGDGLSDRAEQLYHTSPRKADTDGDGTIDSLEDRDHDGRTNGAEQDEPAGADPVGARHLQGG